MNICENFATELNTRMKYVISTHVLIGFIAFVTEIFENGGTWMKVLHIYFMFYYTYEILTFIKFLFDSLNIFTT